MLLNDVYSPTFYHKTKQILVIFFCIACYIVSLVWWTYLLTRLCRVDGASIANSVSIVIVVFVWMMYEWQQRWKESSSGRHAHSILRPPDGRLQIGRSDPWYLIDLKFFLLLLSFYFIFECDIAKFINLIYFVFGF